MFYLLILAFMFLFPIIYLKYFKKLSDKKVEAELMPKSQGLKKEIVGSLALFSALFLGFIVIVLAISIVDVTLSFAGIDNVRLNDLDKVEDLVGEEFSSAPENFLIVLVIALFAEEFFFRAFLTQRIGIIPSTILFTLAHYGYGSIAEMIGVFFLGLILAYWFKKNKSMIQNYFGHLFYDLFAILLYFF